LKKESDVPSESLVAWARRGDRPRVLDPDKDRIPMKRFLFWFLVALAAVALIRSHRRHERVYEPRTLIIHEAPDGVHRVGPAGRKVISIDHRGRKVVTTDESGEVVSEIMFDGGDGRNDGFSPQGPARVEVDGLPVPVVPGTRVDQARIEPPAPPKAPRPPKAPKPPKPAEVKVRVRPFARASRPAPVPVTRPEDQRTVRGQISATEDRARNDARAQLVRQVAEWVAPEVPKGWKVPGRLVDGLVREVRVAPRVRDYGTLYEATMLADFSTQRRAEIVGAYRHEQTVQKLTLLGGLLAFVLVCLAVLSGYIRADEATKGYYTTRLRLAAATGVGAAGVLIYQWLT
jgi:hypothetical protein